MNVRHVTGTFTQTQAAAGRRILLLGLASLLGWLPTLGQAAHPYDRWAEELGIDTDVSYDGTRLMTFEGQQMTVTERRAPGKLYTEMQTQGMGSAVILREDLGKSYILLPSMGVYREESLEGGLMQASAGMEFSKIEAAGQEVINGYSTTKYKTKFKDNEGNGAGFIWVTDSGIPLKLDMIYSTRKMKGKRLSSEFTELNLRDQDAAYFELPSNLQPMNMGNMSSMARMMQQGQMGQPGQAGQPGAAQQGQSEEQPAADEGSESGNPVGRTIRDGFGKLFGR